jgi:hypothetical protein
MTWDQFYDLLHIKEFIYFISSPQIQDMLFPVKMVFIFCSLFFFIFVIYFMLRSSWLHHKFVEEVSEFFSWQAYGQKELIKQWNRIKKRTESGAEADYKLAIIDADDFLIEVLEERGFDQESFEENIKRASKLIPNIYSEVLNAHEIRNLIVYNPDYKLTTDHAKRILNTYEQAINGIGVE